LEAMGRESGVPMTEEKRADRRQIGGKFPPVFRGGNEVEKREESGGKDWISIMWPSEKRYQCVAKSDCGLVPRTAADRCNYQKL